MFKSKTTSLIPLTCNFELFFDLKKGIQFLCLIHRPL